MKALISYFTKRPVVANVLMFGILFSAISLWPKVGKEEMPEFAMNWIRATIAYPGASGEDVELFITKPVEEKLKGVTGLEEVSSSSSYGSSTFSIDFEPNTGNLAEKIQEVKDAIESVQLPREAEEPVYRQWRSSEKAIIDVGIFLKDQEMLGYEERRKLQEYALAFKNSLLTLKSISGVDTSGYLLPELQIKVHPDKLKKYEISMNRVKEQILQQNIRQPLGSMKDKGESEITIVSELDNVEALENVIVTSGFQGQKIHLSDIASVERGYEDSLSVLKIQGREGIRLSVQKSSNTDILTARKAVGDFIEQFQQNNEGSGVGVVLIDDESYDVRNRLSLIGANGLLGFVLIAIVLFIFLDFKSGIWVAMGIPFCLAFTLICSAVLGYTVNNMTLAAIIIVLGIVVDDAIIVAENVQRNQMKGGLSPEDAAHQVFSPIVASVLTTCAAFVPLYFFSGRFGMFVKVIPTIVFLMLLASLLESAFILPAHMKEELPLLGRIKKFFGQKRIGEGKRERLIHRMEDQYANLLRKILPWRIPVLLLFAALLGASFYLFQEKMNYVMFPREESRDFSVKVTAKEPLKRREMARKVGELERIFLKDPFDVVTSIRTWIGQSRRGGEVRENEASLRVEIVAPSEREISLNELIAFWEKEARKLEGYEEIRFLKSRFGSDSGSPLEIQILANNDEVRNQLALELKEGMEKFPALSNIEIEKPLRKQEYRLVINRSLASRLGINYSQLAGALRSYIEGDILYTLNKGEEEVDVRFTSSDISKTSLERLLELTVGNREDYLVPVKSLVKVEEGKKPANIQRENFKRAMVVYGDMKPEVKTTPLEIAEKLENELFPRLLKGRPGAELKFIGEVEDSRESQGDFSLSVMMALGLIYVMLVFLFDSLVTPLLIGAIIPFGAVGVVFAFILHGMPQYGFFAVIGTLGMIGVVINDSIVLVNKLESDQPRANLDKDSKFEFVALTTSTRLRAVIVTTLTTVAGLFPTAYGFGGYDSMLAEMMLAMGWGLLFGMFITLLLVPCMYSLYFDFKARMRSR